MTFTDDLIACRDHVREALVAEAIKRIEVDDLSWIERERWAVTVAANTWATAHGDGTITVDDVAACEGMASGHYDYADKFALYVAERILRQRLTKQEQA